MTIACLASNSCIEFGPAQPKLFYGYYQPTTYMQRVINFQMIFPQLYSSLLERCQKKSNCTWRTSQCSALSLDLQFAYYLYNTGQFNELMSISLTFPDFSWILYGVLYPGFPTFINIADIARMRGCFAAAQEDLQRSTTLEHRESADEVVHFGGENWSTLKFKHFILGAIH